MTPAVVRYALASFARTQRWMAPTLIWLVVLGALYATDAGPLNGSYAFTAAVLMPVSAWLTVAVLGCEDPNGRTVLWAAAGGPARAQAGLLAASVVVCLPLAALAVAWPLVLDRHHGVAASSIVIGVVAHLVCLLVGVGLGGLVAPPVLYAPGVAALIIVGGSALTLLSPVPPMGPLLQLLSKTHPGALALHFTLITAESLALAVVLLTLALRLTRRRA